MDNAALLAAMNGIILFTSNTIQYHAVEPAAPVALDAMLLWFAGLGKRLDFPVPAS